MLTPETVPLVVGAAVGATHAIAHNVAGERALFDAAGVNTAGIAVSLAATIATYLVLNPEVLPV